MFPAHILFTTFMRSYLLFPSTPVDHGDKARRRNENSRTWAPNLIFVFHDQIVRLLEVLREQEFAEDERVRLSAYLNHRD